MPKGTQTGGWLSFNGSSQHTDINKLTLVTFFIKEVHTVKFNNKP